MKLPFLAEQEEATVSLYRKRVVHIQALDYSSSAMSQLNTNYRDIPLNHLFGSLYINFSLIWEPVLKVIVTYANKDCDQFWPIFIKKLKGEENVKMIEEPSFESIILEELGKRVYRTKDKVDEFNYKLLLWRCMEMITGFCEVKNRDFVGIFIEFVEGNFFKSDSEDAKSCSIKKHIKDQDETDRDDDNEGKLN